MQFRPSAKATQLSNQNTLIIMAVMLFIIVLSIVLASVAFVQNDELFEDDDFDDFLAFEGSIAIWAITSIPLLLLSHLVDSKFHILAVTVEYLKGHIGKKRFGDSIVNLNQFFGSGFHMTTLFNLRSSYVFSGPCFTKLACAD